MQRQITLQTPPGKPCIACSSVTLIQRYTHTPSNSREPVPGEAPRSKQGAHPIHLVSLFHLGLVGGQMRIDKAQLVAPNLTRDRDRAFVGSHSGDPCGHSCRRSVAEQHVHVVPREHHKPHLPHAHMLPHLHARHIFLPVVCKNRTWHSDSQHIERHPTSSTLEGGTLRQCCK